MISKVGVIGAGMMGAEIALCFERAGYETILNYGIACYKKRCKVMVDK